jgi:hypothetical protein
MPFPQATKHCAHPDHLGGGFKRAVALCGALSRASPYGYLVDKVESQRMFKVSRKLGDLMCPACELLILSNNYLARTTDE